MVELSLLTWFGYVVRMGDERYHKMAWQGRTHAKGLKGSPQLTWGEGMHKIWKGQGIDWKELRAMVRDYERRKALCTPLTFVSRRRLTK